MKLSDDAPRQYNHRLALFGMGGMGKTQLAIEFVVTHLDIYSHVFWISAGKESDIISGFQDIGHLIGFVPSGTPDQEKLKKEVLMWFKQNEGWLLVLDNLDDITIIRPYLPHITSPGHVLITTRDANAFDIPAQALKIDIFDMDEACNLLLLRTNLYESPSEEVSAEALKIVTELGFLPIAIEQASAYIRVRLKDIFKFQEVYNQHRQEILAKRPKNWDYPETVATTWSLAFTSIEKNAEAKFLLHLFAFLNPDGISMKLLELGLRSDRPQLHVLRTMAIKTYEFNEALAELEQFSLISRRMGGQIISIHRLVQAVLQDNMNGPDRSNYMGMVIELIWAALPESEEEEFRWKGYLQDQTIGPLLLLLKLGYSTKRLASVLQIVGRTLYEESKFADAGTLMASAVKIWIAKLGHVDPTVLTAMDDLGTICRKRSWFQKAVVLHETSLQGCDRIFGKENPNTLIAMSHLAESYIEVGRVEEALALCEKVFEIGRNTRGESHEETLKSMLPLANIYATVGRIKESLAVNERVSDLSRTTLGEEHLSTLECMEQLGRRYAYVGRAKESVAIHENVMEVRRRILGEKHHMTLTSMANLAAAHSVLHQFKEAASLNEKILEPLQETLGEEHEETLTCMSNLAASYRHLGRGKEAAILLEKVTEFSQRLFGEENSHTLHFMNKLGGAYRSLRRLDEAADLFEKVAEIHGRRFGNDHPDTLIFIDNLATTRIDLGQPKEAADLQEKVLEIQKKRFGDEHPDTLTCMNNLALAYVGLCRFKDAISLLEKVLGGRIKVLGTEHPETRGAAMDLMFAKYMQQSSESD